MLHFTCGTGEVQTELENMGHATGQRCLPIQRHTGLLVSAAYGSVALGEFISQIRREKRCSGGWAAAPSLPSTCGETLLSAASSEHGRWHTVAQRCSSGGTSLRGTQHPSFPNKSYIKLINGQSLRCTLGKRPGSTGMGKGLVLCFPRHLAAPTSLNVALAERGGAALAARQLLLHVLPKKWW